MNTINIGDVVNTENNGRLKVLDIFVSVTDPHTRIFEVVDLQAEEQSSFYLLEADVLADIAP